MANTHFIIFTSMVILLKLAFTSASANEYLPTKILEKKTEVVVEGVVYCQSCAHYGTWSLAGARPIHKAKVSVTCRNHKGQVSFYKVYETDKNGYFYALLDGFKMTHILDHPLQSCFVKPVSSPLENCDALSNVNDGLKGCSLRYDKKRQKGINYERVIFATLPLAFRPAQCPSTTHN